MTLLTFFEKFLALILSFLCLWNPLLSGNYKYDDEPISATKHNYDFDNNRLLLGAYSLPHSSKDVELSNLAVEAGLDFVICNNTNEEFLNACDENGLGVILNGSSVLPGSYEVIGDTAYEKWMNITKEKYYSAAENKHSCIWGNDLIDEPGSAQFQKINDMLGAYHKATDYRKLGLVNLFPLGVGGDRLNNEAADVEIRSNNALLGIDWLNPDINRYRYHVSDYVSKIDTEYISFDKYPFRYDENMKKTTDGDWIANLDVVSSVCRETGRDMYVITQVSGVINSKGERRDPDNDRRYCDTPEDIRWQSYVSIAFGAAAIIHANYYTGWWDHESHMIDDNQEKTNSYYAVKTVNEELAAFADIYKNYDDKGAYMLNMRKGVNISTNYITPVQNKYKPTAFSSDPVLIGCFDGGDEGKAFTFVNMYEPEEEKEASFTSYFSGAKEITVYRKGAAETVKGNRLSLTLEPAEGVYVTVKY